MIRRAVTLVELVVALSLAALLMMALAGVLSSLSQQRKRVAQSPRGEWSFEVKRMIWADLSQAHQVWLDSEGLKLTIPGNGREGISGPPLINYRVLPWGNNRRRLARLQFSGKNSLPDREQTLVFDVSRFAVERIDNQGVLQPLPRNAGPTPRSLAVEIRLMDESDSLRHVITVR